MYDFCLITLPSGPYSFQAASLAYWSVLIMIFNLSPLPSAAAFLVTDAVFKSSFIGFELIVKIFAETSVAEPTFARTFGSCIFSVCSNARFPVQLNVWAAESEEEYSISIAVIGVSPKFITEIYGITSSVQPYIFSAVAPILIAPSCGMLETIGLQLAPV